MKVALKKVSQDFKPLKIVRIPVTSLIMISSEEEDMFRFSDDYLFPPDWLDVEARDLPDPERPPERDPLPMPEFNCEPAEMVHFDNVLCLKKFLETFEVEDESEWCIVIPVHMVTLLRAYMKSRKSNDVMLMRRRLIQNLNET